MTAKFVKKQTVHDEVTHITAHFDMKEWRADAKGYFLIRVNQDTKEIEVGFCNYKHEILITIHGKTAKEITATIVRKELISSLQHACYLGRELQKAECALIENKDYVQDDELC